MSLKLSVGGELTAQTKALGENVMKCHFVHLKSNITWPGIELRSPSVELGDCSSELCY
jgi:hypothetical protein